ncbi:hypothetical protein EJB05_48150, partial [Eragrostis curvula]
MAMFCVKFGIVPRQKIENSNWECIYTMELVLKVVAQLLKENVAFGISFGKSMHSAEINANLLMVLWRVWNVTNGVLQAGEKISIGDSVEFLKRYMAALLQIRQQEPVPDDKGKKSLFSQKLCSMPRAITTDKRWVPPDKNVLKINVDGAFMESSSAAAVGVVIRDNTGSPLLTAWRILFYCRDAEEVEITACLEGIKLAARWDDREFILETDCASAVHLLRASESESVRDHVDRERVPPATLAGGVESGCIDIT